MDENVSVTETTAIRVNGSYFTKDVLIPYPDTYTTKRKYEVNADFVFSVCERILENVTVNREFSLPISPEQLIEELLSVIESELKSDVKLSSKPSVGAKINGLYRINASNTSDSKIYNDGVVVHITRILVQTVFDNFRSKGTTHMSVKDPLTVTEHEWREVDTKEHGKQPVSFSCTDVEALELSGNWFTDPVIIPAPEKRHVSHGTAADITKQLLSDVINTHGETGEEFNAVKTALFVQWLKRKFKQVCQIHSSTPGEKTGSIPQCVLDSISSTLTQSSYTDTPEMIYDRTVILYIVRVVVQTIFDQSRDTQSHMSVENLFDVTTHKWNEITTQPTES